ncbi:MAG: type II CRISPR-associated endonuclease Cas1, partial [Actinobacteria bacterium]|nr:type II CRISPR-associated endonuclease Cas1 [Actinomycetota bacterium]
MRRVVEIAHDNRHLHVERGFLVVDDVGDTRGELGRVPFADIEAVIAHGHGITYSNAVLVHLAEESAPLVVVDSHHMVVGMLLSCAGNSVQAHRFEAQIGASRPANKRVWAQIVRAKVMQQAAVLEAVGQSGARLRALAGSVRSGDPGNIEAQAARAYWPALFGTSFRRGSGGREPNGFLNYGYTVLRASTARAVVAAGLHPAIGIHHSNDANPMRLVDDLMEPFRPFMDLQTWLLWRDGHADLGKAE